MQLPKHKIDVWSIFDAIKNDYLNTECLVDNELQSNCDQLNEQNSLLCFIFSDFFLITSIFFYHIWQYF